MRLQPIFEIFRTIKPYNYIHQVTMPLRLSDLDSELAFSPKTGISVYWTLRFQLNQTCPFSFPFELSLESSCLRLWERDGSAHISVMWILSWLITCLKYTKHMIEVHKEYWCNTHTHTRMYVYIIFVIVGYLAGTYLFPATSRTCSAQECLCTTYLPG